MQSQEEHELAVQARAQLFSRSQKRIVKGARMMNPELQGRRKECLSPQSQNLVSDQNNHCSHFCYTEERGCNVMVPSSVNIQAPPFITRYRFTRFKAFMTLVIPLDLFAFRFPAFALDPALPPC
mmetsp:Transcript_3285/g.20464  ORF Transcript_3285/g.20464 Transcript_3285/m.20464 type:complete len:124 (-) Transcript_3285:829-1200(-)